MRALDALHSSVCSRRLEIGNTRCVMRFERWQVLRDVEQIFDVNEFPDMRKRKSRKKMMDPLFRRVDKVRKLT